MRVAMVSNYPVDPKVVPGGVTAVAHELTRGLGRLSELDLHLVCCQTDVESDRTESRDGATIHFLHDADRFSLLLHHLPQRRKIGRLIREIDPDLVHAQGLGVAAAAGLDSHRPYAVTVHGVSWKESHVHLPTRVKRWRAKVRADMERRQMLRSSNVFIISQYAAEMLPPGPAYRQFQINNPVGDRIFEIESEPSSPHVLVVGGLRQRKDPLTAVRVMEQVIERIPEATMHLLGPPSRTPLDDEVREAVLSRGLEGRVALLGLVPEEVLWEEYSKASVLLMTSIEETAPVAIGEAYAVGIPVVGTRAGGVPFMVHENETGFLHEIGDAEGLAESVVKILSDSGLRARLAAKAAQIGRAEYSLDAIARKTFEAYGEILSS